MNVSFVNEWDLDHVFLPRNVDSFSYFTIYKYYQQDLKSWKNIFCDKSIIFSKVSKVKQVKIKQNLTTWINGISYVQTIFERYHMLYPDHGYDIKNYIIVLLHHFRL